MMGGTWRLRTVAESYKALEEELEGEALFEKGDASPYESIAFVQVGLPQA